MEITLKEFAAMGGKARGKKLSKKRKREIAMMGVKARLDKMAIPKRSK